MNLIPGAMEVRFDYFGLSSIAFIKRTAENRRSYQCVLPESGEEIFLEGTDMQGMLWWKDVRYNSVTPLSQLLGQAIEESGL